MSKIKVVFLTDYNGFQKKGDVLEINGNLFEYLNKKGVCKKFEVEKPITKPIEVEKTKPEIKKEVVKPKKKTTKKTTKK